MTNNKARNLIRGMAIATLFVATSALSYSGVSGQVGGKTSYSVGQLQEMLNKSPGYNSSTMSYYANTLKFESGGNVGIVNQYGMTGLGQLSPSNIKKLTGMTVEQYANTSAQFQVDTMVKYTNAAMQDPTVKQLQQMQAAGQTLGGKPIDSATLLACTQFGNKVCAAAIASNCSAGADGNGITVCAMADKIRGVAGGTQDPTDPNQGTTPNPGQTASNNGQISGSDISVDKCWECEAIVKAFNMLTPIFNSVPDALSLKLIGFFAGIFAIYMTFKVAENFFFPISYNQPHLIIGMWIRFSVVMLILGSNAIFSNYILYYAMAPAIGAGGQVGAAIATKAASVFGVN